MLFTGNEADALDFEATKQEFEDAMEHVGTTKGTVLCESVQRRLFGLHARATRGPPPQQLPTGMHFEQLAAWQEAGGLSELAAMQEYVDVVSKHDPSFLMGETGGNSDAEMKQPACKDTGATSVMAPASDIFEAARAGATLAGFLPQGCGLVDSEGLTALIHAVDAEQHEAVAELLLANADANRADPQGSTPLHYAALLGSTMLAEQLLAAGADPRRLDEDGVSASDAASTEGHKVLAETLSEAATRYCG
mmetsp:Transcript_128328/g.256310  ORF Transcript_128328/g.256310 Transcript_128328/m.256310 type:complete len:250 (-) Transcript_128328:10-759(-)